MILTIVLDPILEKEYYVDRLYPKIETLATKISYDLGGKGNVLTKILNNLNLDVFSIGFLGGLNGVYIFDQLKLGEYITILYPLKMIVGEPCIYLRMGS